MFSTRTGWPLAPNRLHQLARARRERGDLLDLTQSNPTACGFDYPRALVLKALGQAAALRYEPQPLGLAAARAAVAQYYAERGLAVDAADLLLTASTSEAYHLLFRLLCNPGDAVAMASPSYPLFEMLAAVNDVRLRACPMLYDHGWQLDLDAMTAADGGLRCLLLVHPNNPTGSYLKPQEWQRLQATAAERGWALVVDEVFFDYAIAPAQPQSLDYSGLPALTFVLNGFSKVAALPQMKLAWIHVAGPAGPRREALARLEVLNDLFLSVDAPIQHAAPAILGLRHGIQNQIRARLGHNLACLDAALAAAPAAGASRLAVEAGWNAILRLPRIHTDETWAERLVEQAGVLTHPGHFYGFSQEACLVISLLGPEAQFDRGVAAMLLVAAAEAGAPTAPPGPSQP